MEVDTRPRSPLKRMFLIYGPLFLVPALGVFVFVLMRFQGLPPRYSTEIVFQVDPRLGSSALNMGEDTATGGTLMMDVRSIAIELKSRDRLREALQGLDIYEEKTTEEKKQLFVDQTLENMRVKVERKFGEDAFLVRVSVDLPVRDPAPLEDLVERIRNVYKKYNIEKLTLQAKRDVDSLDRQRGIIEQDFQNAENDLNAFQNKDRNQQHLGDPPPLFVTLQEKQSELMKLENKTGEEDQKRREEIENEIQKLEELHRNTPSIKRRFNALKGRRDSFLEKLESMDNDVRQAKEGLRYFTDQSQERFNVLKKPESRPVESEQSSRLLLGAALGVMAGLLVLLLALVFGILGGD